MAIGSCSAAAAAVQASNFYDCRTNGFRKSLPQQLLQDLLYIDMHPITGNET